MLEIHPIPVLEDNYAYLLRSEQVTAVVDPSEAPPVQRALEERGWKLDLILNTHHHWDHVGGNPQLKAAYQCPVWGWGGDSHRIELDRQLSGEEEIEVGSARGRVLSIPGHTLGHMALYFEEDRAVFSGDTLFLMGCGRLFEGTPEQMWASLCRLRALPEETRVFCGHEYTEANLDFAESLGAPSLELQERGKRDRRARQDGLPTVPGTIGEEKRTNPFLRADEFAFQNAVGMIGGAVDVFARLREKRDNF